MERRARRTPNRHIRRTAVKRLALRQPTAVLELTACSRSRTRDRPRHGGGDCTSGHVRPAGSHVSRAPHLTGVGPQRALVKPPLGPHRAPERVNRC
ncbi:hypothetical protein AAFF_G00267700 [Aldrovandia affinis]|uniref:Uncharacterized protein n=1 Tax=Aldrovandia affinis TaxID=143900 RepID=A0AAD7WSF4_9TELE|nr:hypothetical protein AAFF_G00267700 [Aldrovandia affinis]